MKKWILLILSFPLWTMPSVAQIGLYLNNSNFYALEAGFHNPAAIAFPQRIQGMVGTQFLYAGLAGDLRSDIASYVHPLSDDLAFGLRGVYFNSHLLQQGNFSALLAQKLFGDRLSVGMNFNVLTYAYDKDKFSPDFDPNDPVAKRGSSKNVFSFGMGLLFRPRWWLAFGMSFDDINRPNLAIGGEAFKKQPVAKFGLCVTAYPLMPQIDVMIKGDEVLLQGAVRQSLLEQRLNFLAGYDFSGKDKKELFLEANFVHGQFGVSYSYQYSLNAVSEIAGGSHRVALQFSDGGFPRVYSAPIIKLDNPTFSRVDSSTIRLTGKISHRTGIGRVVILHNDEQAKEIVDPQKPNEMNLSIEMPLTAGKNEFQVVVYGEKVHRSPRIVAIALATANLPEITIVPPEESRLSSGVVKTKAKTVRLRYKVTKVDSLADVQIKVNKNRLETRDLRVQEKTEKGFTLWQDIDLNEGQNLIEVRASNQVGSKNAELKIFYNPLLDTLLYRKTWAVIIGIDKYRDPNVGHLDFAVRDATGVEKMLREKFKFDHFITLYNDDATNDRIIAALSDSLQKADPEDGVFVFFAGHGFTVVTARGDTIGGIVPYDGAFGVYTPNISMEQIRDTARLVNAKHIFYVMDACYSGALLVKIRGTPKSNATLSSRIKEFVSKPARDVLTTGQQGEEVLDGGRNNHSIFTGWLLEGLEGVADADQDSYVTANELSRYVYENVIKDAKIHRIRQTPQFGKLTTDNGEFVFVPK
ncbi:MAG: caspase family protein [bacterium]